MVFSIMHTDRTPTCSSLSECHTDEYMIYIATPNRSKSFLLLQSHAAALAHTDTFPDNASRWHTLRVNVLIIGRDKLVVGPPDASQSVMYIVLTVIN